MGNYLFIHSSFFNKISSDPGKNLRIKIEQFLFHDKK